MFYNFLRSSAFLVLCALLSFTAMAGDGSGDKLPSAILVMLNTETNRIAGLEKANMKDKVVIVKKDGEEERKAMIYDFTDHFDFCPVYYFMDTNLDAIKAGQFAGHLLTKDGTTIAPVPAAVSSGSYLIAYYGIPLKQYANEDVKQGDSNGYNETLEFGKGLIVCNSKMVQRSYLYKFAYGKSFTGDNAKDKYRYTSKTFDIEYYPFVKKFNKQLKKQREDAK